MSVLLTLAAVAAAALGTAEILDYTRADAEAQPGAAGITAATVGVLVLTLAFYTGGYVAGRLARFDGGRKGSACGCSRSCSRCSRPAPVRC